MDETPTMNATARPDTATSLDWRWYAFDQFTKQQLYAVLAAREAVFIVEQDCAYHDLDGMDADAQHLVAWSAGEVAGYLRLLGPGTRFGEPSLGRILTTARARGTGLGRDLVARGIERAGELYPAQPIRISAQAHLSKFYGSFGFEVASEPYLEDGIPHVEMLRA
jgi:ElaA protein